MKERNRTKQNRNVCFVFFFFLVINAEKGKEYHESKKIVLTGNTVLQQLIAGINPSKVTAYTEEPASTLHNFIKLCRSGGSSLVKESELPLIGCINSSRCECSA